MKLLNLHINGFGKLQNQDISFQDGINIVYGKNEAGKSTLHTFIRGILFGMERQRGRAARSDLYSRYEPWNSSGTYEGWLRLESQGEIYRIERRFQKDNKSLKIINETKGLEEVPTDELLDRLRCGLTETAYNNTVSIGQLKCATDNGMVTELRNYIANLNTTGSLSLNITRAISLLKRQRKEQEERLVPQAALQYTSLLGEIRKLEQEISAPEYANHLNTIRSRKSSLKQTLGEKQKEKEALLEETARGQQVLSGNQFTDRNSIISYAGSALTQFKKYKEASLVCSRKSPLVFSILLILSGVLMLAGAGIASQLPKLIGLTRLPQPLLMGGFGVFGLVLLAGGIIQLQKRKRWQRERDSYEQQLKDMFSRHLEDSSVNEKSLTDFETKMQEFLSLQERTAQAETNLKQLSAEIDSLQKQEEHCSSELEEQQQLQWELEKKLEHLANLKTQADALQKIIASNDQIYIELEALDLALETITSLSTTIQDSFGFYLNKTASDLIKGITGGIYSSMSIDQSLNVFMNTPTRLVPIEQVSSGTMDQIYLAVRLAAARLVQSPEDSMPLIFDDSFTLYDDERLKTVLNWLSSFQEQIIIFTCHRRESQILTDGGLPFHLISF